MTPLFTKRRLPWIEGLTDTAHILRDLNLAGAARLSRHDFPVRDISHFPR